MTMVDPTGLRESETGSLQDEEANDRRKIKEEKKEKKRKDKERKDKLEDYLDERDEIDEQLRDSESIEETISIEEKLKKMREDNDSAIMDSISGLSEDDYDAIKDIVDPIMNHRLADAATDLVGSDYVWGGKPQNDAGGLDCSGTAEKAIEEASGQFLGTRNANGQAKDPNLTVKGDDSRGTLNYYDWKKKSTGLQDGRYDHVSVSLGDGNMVNPRGDDENKRDNPGKIVIRGPFNTPPDNRQVNWRYMLFD